MKLESGNIKKLFFDNHGVRRYFSGELQVGVYHQNLPAFSFPTVDEDKLTKKVEEMFELKVNKISPSTPCIIISNNNMIWGIANKFGQIFSMESIYIEESSITIKNKTNVLQKFDLDFPNAKKTLSKEDRINAAVAFNGVKENNDMKKTLIRYYNSLILKENLKVSLTENEEKKTTFKI